MPAASKPAGKSPWPSLQELVRNFIGDINANLVDWLSIQAGTGEGERRDREILSPQYGRPLKELEQILAQRSQRKSSEVRVLEMGSFLGVLCFALRKVGFQVTAPDIPEFQKNPRLQARCRRRADLVLAETVAADKHEFGETDALK